MQLTLFDPPPGSAPLVIVWENVPGVLSMPDNTFGCFLGAMVGGDAPLVPGSKQRWTDAGLVVGPRRAAAWRILDAQFFGVPQRRERVFVVASGREIDPGEILFERASGGGNTASRSQKAADVAQTLTGGARSRGGYSTDDADLLPVAGPITCSSAGGAGGVVFKDAAAGHLVFFGGNNCSGPIGLSPALTAAAGRYDFETEAFAVYRTSGDCGAWPTGDVAATLSTGTDRTDQVVAFALRGRDGGAMPEVHGDGKTAGALRASSGGSSNDYVAGGGVRRLTPTEKEALQGFPRGWTCVPPGRARAIDDDEVNYLRGQGADVWRRDDGRWITSAAADGPRGAALGNSMAVPVIRWIGKRINELMKEQVK